MFEQIDKKSASEQFVNFFIHSIIHGKYKENDKLPAERELSKELAIGRSTLREGLRILELIGFIEKKPEGAFIKTTKENLLKEPLNFYLSIEKIDFMDLLEVRKLLEIENVQLAAIRATSTDIKMLKNLNNKMIESKDDWESYVKYDVGFHILIAEITKNSIMLDIFNSIRERLYRYQRTMVSNKEILEKSLSHHLEIVKAIENKDVKMGKELLEKHLSFTEEIFYKYLRKSIFDEGGEAPD